VLALWMRRFLFRGCEYGENLAIIVVFYFCVGAAASTTDYIHPPMTVW
jgi:hypothetical protein